MLHRCSVWSFFFLVFFCAGASLCGSAQSAFAQRSYTVDSVPDVRRQDASAYVSDPEHILKRETILSITSKLKHLQEEKGIEVAVVVLRDIGEQDSKEFATELFARFNVGDKKYDDGLLVLLVTSGEQRSVVFETGYGLEGTLPDIICYRLQQKYMVPLLKTDAYDEALLEGVTALSGYLTANAEDRKTMLGEEKDPEIAVEAIAIVVIWLLLLFIFRKFKGGNMGGPPTGGGGGGFTGRGLGKVIQRQKSFGGLFGGGSGGSSGRSWPGGSRGGSWGGGSSGGGGSRSKF